MKKLLNKTLKPFIIYACLVLLVSIPFYFLLVDWIWSKELDENNQLIAQRIEQEFNEQNISEEDLLKSITFWNEIQPLSSIDFTNKTLAADSTYTIRRHNPYIQKSNPDRFRGLKRNIRINNQHFLLTVETNVEESEETIAYIAAITLLFGLILVTGFIVLTKILSQKLWQPFQSTLKKLQSFRLNTQSDISFEQTDIKEFQELNNSVEKLIQHSVSTYQSQKEFTENASHELQTPIAIIKNKLDILLQNNSLTNNQYNIIEEINLTLLRMSRINKNLLLLAKIDNKQFEDIQQVYLAEVIQRCIYELEAFLENEFIKLETKLEHFSIPANLSLTEILINNLMLNAIRYSEAGETVNITLTTQQLTISNPGRKELDRKVLFERFKKITNDTKGSGLGLSIAKEICYNNNWNLDYQFKNNQHHFIIMF